MPYYIGDLERDPNLENYPGRCERRAGLQHPLYVVPQPVPCHLVVHILRVLVEDETLNP